MTKIDIVSGFLGAGKTTLIQKLLKEALEPKGTVLIENEFGEIGIDGGFLKESGISIREMNSGCICCSLVGDFGASLREVVDTYHPDRILIEPSGVGKLSDVIQAVKNTGLGSVNSAVAVVDASKCKMYMKNFGEFFINQIQYAGTILLSRTDTASPERVREALELIRKHNKDAAVITTPLAQLKGSDVLRTIEGAASLQEELMREFTAEHDHDHEHEHEHEHHHDHDHEHEHHHDHEHEHDHDHEHHHHHHDGHDADEVFTSWGLETPRVFTKENVQAILERLDTGEFGTVLRAKGMVDGGSGVWIYFDYVPGEIQVREGAPDVTGKLCVIGSELREDALGTLFGEADA